MSKKLHAKDLRRDEVAEAVTHAAENTFQFSQQHQRGLLLGGIAVLVVVVAGVVIAWRTDASREAALSAHGAAIEAWQKADAASAPAGETKPTWDEVASGLGKVAEEHAGTPSGRIAAFEHGLALARAGKPKEAADALDAFIAANSSHWAVPQALAALAAAREDAGDAKAAEDAIVKLRDGKWRNWPSGAAQAMLAEFYERQGRLADARSTYEAISKDPKLEGTAWNAQAKSRLEELGAAPPAG